MFGTEGHRVAPGVTGWHITNLTGAPQAPSLGVSRAFSALPFVSSTPSRLTAAVSAEELVERARPLGRQIGLVDVGLGTSSQCVRSVLAMPAGGVGGMLGFGFCGRECG